MELKLTSDDVLMVRRYKNHTEGLAIYECVGCGVDLYDDGAEVSDYDKHTVTRCLQRLHERIGNLRVAVPDA